MIDWIADQGPSEFQNDLDIEILASSTPKTWVDKLL